VKRLAGLAVTAGRKVTNLQWDVARTPFETPKWIERYPEIGGVTNPLIRKAVGIWARDAILKWSKSDDQGLLICEAPLIGNRFGELTQIRGDPSEGVLVHPETVFIIPVPSLKIRRIIELARARTQAAPKNHYEAKDAPVEVIHKLWLQVAQLRENGYLGVHAQGIKSTSTPYDPEIYAAAYQHILRNRKFLRLNIEQQIYDRDSVYDFGVRVHRLIATESEADYLMADVARKYTTETLERETNEWFIG